MRNENYLEVAKNFLQNYHKEAKCAFVSGSMMRGQEKPHSDIDLVVLYDKENNPQAYRENFFYQGWPIEMFCQNENSLQCIFEEERKNRRGIMLNMVSSGIIVPEENFRGQEIKEMAIQILKEGPEPLNKEEMEKDRYFICDMLDDLRDDKSKSEYYGVLSKLYNELGPFYLKANRVWYGDGKALSRLLKNFDEELAEDYQQAFGKAFIDNDMKPVIELAEKMLKPFGGGFWVGYKSFAPDKFNEYQI
jgi:hypothetical protein